MSFNALSNEILVMILKRISLHKQIQFRLVCTRWCVLLEDICRLKTSLKLFSRLGDICNYSDRLREAHPDDVDYWALKNTPGQEDDFILVKGHHFTESKLFALFVRLFPNLEQLIVFFTSNLFFKNLPSLLRKYNNNLTSLSICGVFDYDDKIDDSVDEHLNDNFIPNRILHSINSITSLRRLDLLVVNFYFPELSTALVSSVLPKLERFSVCNTDDDYDFSWIAEKWQLVRPIMPGPEIETLGSSCSHLRLFLTNFNDPKEELASALRSNVHLCNNLKHLHLTNLSDSGFESIICQTLKSLQYLSLGFSVKDPIPFCDELIDNIRQLTNLNELRIEYATCDPEFVTLPDPKQIPPRDAMYSVTSLTLINFWQDTDDINSNDGELICKAISAWFPRLQQLTIKSFDEDFLQVIRSHLNMFPHLQSHKLYSRDDRDALRTFLGRHRALIQT